MSKYMSKYIEIFIEKVMFHLFDVKDFEIKFCRI